MNTNGNVYTVIYSTVLVVVVAAVLAVAAIVLQPMQNENIKIETVTKVLSAAAQSDEDFSIAEDDNVMELYADNIVEAVYVDGNGQVVGQMNTGKDNIQDIQVTTTSDLKKQNDMFKKIEAGQTGLLEELRLPVYIFNIEGKKISVMPCYGAGLWGPIWGYIAVAADGRTIEGAVFDHKGETPGLGAKITENFFSEEFIDKRFASEEPVFAVLKAGAAGNEESSVDAISGATITSQALGKSINLWAKYYKPYFNGTAAETSCTDGCCGETAHQCSEEECAACDKAEGCAGKHTGCNGCAEENVVVLPEGCCGGCNGTGCADKNVEPKVEEIK